MAAIYQQGATVYELAAEYGCNRQTVAERLKKAGVAMRLATPSTLELQTIAELRMQGLPLTAIAARVGFSASTVHNQLKRLNVSQNPPTEQVVTRSS